MRNEREREKKAVDATDAAAVLSPPPSETERTGTSHVGEGEGARGRGEEKARWGTGDCREKREKRGMHDAGSEGGRESVESERKRGLWISEWTSGVCSGRLRLRATIASDAEEQIYFRKLE